MKDETKHLLGILSLIGLNISCVVYGCFLMLNEFIKVPLTTIGLLVICIAGYEIYLLKLVSQGWLNWKQKK